MNAIRTITLIIGLAGIAAGAEAKPEDLKDVIKRADRISGRCELPALPPDDGEDDTIRAAKQACADKIRAADVFARPVKMKLALSSVDSEDDTLILRGRVVPRKRTEHEFRTDEELREIGEVRARCEHAKEQKEYWDETIDEREEDDDAYYRREAGRLELNDPDELKEADKQEEKTWKQTYKVCKDDLKRIEAKYAFAAEGRQRIFETVGVTVTIPPRIASRYERNNLARQTKLKITVKVTGFDFLPPAGEGLHLPLAIGELHCELIALEYK